MAIDTQNKRRSVTGMPHLFTVAPVADGTIDIRDRTQVNNLYSGELILISIDGFMTVIFTSTNPFTTTFTDDQPFSIIFTSVGEE